MEIENAVIVLFSNNACIYFNEIIHSLSFRENLRLKVFSDNPAIIVVVVLCYRNCRGSVAVALWKFRRWHYQLANLLTEEGLVDGGIVIMCIKIILV